MLAGGRSQAQNIYISPQGSDTGPGTESAPLKTLTAALAKVRNNAAGKTIYLKGGTYVIDATINLDANHSGAEGNPLVIRSLPGENIILTGSSAIPGDLFRKLSNTALLNRLPEKARGQVYVASLAKEHFFDNTPGKGNYGLLSWNGNILTLAQWPNRGFGYIQKTLDEGPATRWLKPGENEAPYSFEKPAGGTIEVRVADDLDMTALKKEIKRTKDVAIEGYFSNDWQYEHGTFGKSPTNLGNLVAKVNPSANTIQLLRSTRYGIDISKQSLPRRIKIRNSLSHLDEPGEWYYDRTTRLLYVWPVQIPNDTRPMSVVGATTLIRGKGVSNIMVRDIIFENMGQEGVVFENGDNILVAGCTFRSGTGRGLQIANGINNGIHACNFYDLNNAFRLYGVGENRKNLIPENNYATNNHIYNCRLKGYGLISLGGVGLRFANNLLHDMNGGILVAANDLVFEHNEFYNMGYAMGDWNVLYFGGNLTFYNNQIRNNFVHHLMETPRAYPVAAFRTDDGATGLRVDGNIFYKAGRSTVESSGPDNHIKNNIVMETRLIWGSHQTPRKKISKAQFLQEKWDRHLEIQAEIAAGKLSVHEKENYIGRAELVFGKEGWKNNTTWITRYPIIPKIFNFFDPDGNPWMPCYDTIRTNYISGGKNFPYYAHGKNPASTITDLRNHLPATCYLEMPVVFDPHQMFEDADNLDFRLWNDFVLMDGFKKIKYDSIGLYVDEFRPVVPNKMLYRTGVKDKYAGIPSSGGTFDYDKINQRYPIPPYMADTVTYKFTLNAKDSEGTPVDGASLIVDNRTYRDVDYDGSIEVPVVYAGSYSYTVQHPHFEDGNGTLEVIDEHIIRNINLKSRANPPLTYPIIFKVIDPDGNNLTAAEVRFEDIVYPDFDNDGTIEVKYIESGTNMAYTISMPGYLPQEGQLDVVDNAVTITVTLQPDVVTGLGNSIDLGKVEAYPNPVTVYEVIKLKLPSGSHAGVYHIEITNTQGNVVRTVRATTQQNKIEISTRQMSPGYYHVKIVYPGQKRKISGIRIVVVK